MRVSALPFGSGYFAVIHRAGSPDEIMDGPDGRPRLFGTATEAIGAGKRLVPEPLPDAIAAWRRLRDDGLAGELDRVFAPGDRA